MFFFKLQMNFFMVLGFALVLTVYSDCSRPTGTDCGWYRTCLEDKITCGSSGYALKYADHFCNQYERNLNKFSPYGKKWVSAVKKCLQQKLAPYLDDPYVKCSTLKQVAFQSHVPCYVKPASGISFCSLPWKDYWQVYQTIKGAVLSEFQATVSGGWDTVIGCFKQGKK